MIRRTAVVLLVAGCLTGCVEGATAPPAAASAVCSIAGAVSGLLGKACTVVSGPVGKLAGKLLGGSSGGGGGGSAATAGAGLAAAGLWAFVGAKFALKETSKVLGESTSPRLGSTWFSASYWRMTAISALLTLPFLCAAAVQALMRFDLAMLARAAFGYLPLAALAIAVAAPVTTLLLAGSDEMSRLVASATGTANAHLLRGAGLIAGFASLSRASAFFTFVVSGLTIAGALALWLELIIREAAVYVIVLMLPLAFAAMVWPARRVWAIRAVELLVALILSKFAIVAVLTLGGAALNRIGHVGIGAAIAGIALLMLAAFAPWALLRLLPLSELASGVASGLRREAAGSATAMTNSVSGVLSPTAGYTEDSAGSSYGTPSMMENVDGTARSGRDGGDPVPAGGATVASGGGTAGAPTSNGSAGGAAPAGTGPGAGDSGTAANGATPASGHHSDGAVERIPGLDHVWQAADGEHRTLTLGGADDQTPVYPPDAPREQPPPADDHDPRPERQPPDGDE
jgi:hypothetical protein